MSRTRRRSNIDSDGDIIDGEQYSPNDTNVRPATWTRQAVVNAASWNHQMSPRERELQRIAQGILEDSKNKFEGHNIGDGMVPVEGLREILEENAKQRNRARRRQRVR